MHEMVVPQLQNYLKTQSNFKIIDPAFSNYTYIKITYDLGGASLAPHSPPPPHTHHIPPLLLKEQLHIPLCSGKITKQTPLKYKTIDKASHNHKTQNHCAKSSSIDFDLARTNGLNKY